MTNPDEAVQGPAIHLSSARQMSKYAESWSLFWVLAIATSVATLAILPGTELSTAKGTVFAIGHAVRCSLPAFLATFVASSLAALWPSQSTRWMASNRRYFGLAFAVGMGWQLVFIGWLALTQTAYAVRNLINWVTFLTGVVPYLFLFAMVLTSFHRFGRHLTVRTWRNVHKSGIYVLWFVITGTYLLYVISGVPGPNAFRSALLSLLLSAWVLRILAWRRKRFGRSASAAHVRG